MEAMLTDSTRQSVSVPPACVTRSKSARIGWLDGLRALAIAGVILVHSSQVVHGAPYYVTKVCELGQYGVQLFFVISAITIYFTLSAHLERNESVSSWYIRRFFRIAPLYYSAIAVYAIDHVIQRRLGGLDFGGLGIQPMLANIAFVHGLVSAGNNNVVPGGWSIGVEMSFYVLAPLLYFVMRRKSLWPMVFIGFGSICILLTVVAQLRISASGHVGNNTFLYYWSFTQFPVFLCGMALVHLSRNWFYSGERTPAFVSWMAAVVGSSALIVAALCGTWGNRSHSLAPLLFGIGFSCLVLIARDHLKPFFEHKIVVLIGTLSYSMYIVHFAFLDAIRLTLKRAPQFRAIPPTLQLLLITAAMFIISVLASIPVRRIIEQPGIQLGARIASRREKAALLPLKNQ